MNWLISSTNSKTCKGTGEECPLPSMTLSSRFDGSDFSCQALVRLFSFPFYFSAGWLGAAALILLSLQACSPSTSSARLIKPSGAEIPELSRIGNLQIEAEATLGGREGTLLILDALRGQWLALANPRLAMEQPYPPGSALKPFTALAAYRAGLLEPARDYGCRGLYQEAGWSIACSHPRISSPFGFTKALAYSCNGYFASLAGHLSPSAFFHTLGEFGLVNPSGGGHEGLSFQRGGLTPAALGEGGEVKMVPARLLRAYAALFNGGKLWQLPAVPGRPGKVHLEKQLDIPAPFVEMAVKAMREAVLFGTASASGLQELDFKIIGKTGTSTSSNGFRTQGWFIGLCAPPWRKEEPAEANRIAVLVFLKRGHGSECARLARTLFDILQRKEEGPGQLLGEGTQDETKHKPASVPTSRPLPADAEVRLWISGGKS